MINRISSPSSVIRLAFMCLCWALVIMTTNADHDLSSEIKGREVIRSWPQSNRTSLRIHVSLPLKFMLNQTADDFYDWSETNQQSKESVSHSRTKRGIIQLAGMIKCMTGCEPLSYGRYGCFCGYMGAGIPVDPIDKCCRNHDRCYSHSSCSHIMQYLLPYKWKCMTNGMVKCSVPDHDLITSKCAFQLCECDRRLGECLRHYKCPRKKPTCPFPRH